MAPAYLSLPPNMPNEVLHEATFKIVGDGQTELTVSEYDWPVGHMMEMSKMGMEQCRDKMAAIFARAWGGEDESLRRLFAFNMVTAKGYEGNASNGENGHRQSGAGLRAAIQKTTIKAVSFRLAS